MNATDFNISNIYDKSNSEKIPVGSKGFLADTLDDLSLSFEKGITDTIKKIRLNTIYPFVSEESGIDFRYFYLVEKSIRPMTEEEIETWWRNSENIKIEMIPDENSRHDCPILGTLQIVTCNYHKYYIIGATRYIYEDFVRLARKMDGSTFYVKNN